MNKRETTKQAMYDRITHHGEQLNLIFTTKYGPVPLCKKLRVIEGKLSRLTTDLCNGTIEQDVADAKIDRLLISVDNILHFTHAGIPVFCNRDPRGYALKIRSEYMTEHNINLHRDLGGYGIIAPDLTEGN